MGASRSCRTVVPRGQGKAAAACPPQSRLQVGSGRMVGSCCPTADSRMPAVPRAIAHAVPATCASGTDGAWSGSRRRRGGAQDRATAQPRSTGSSRSAIRGCARRGDVGGSQPWRVSFGRPCAYWQRHQDLWMPASRYKRAGSIDSNCATLDHCAICGGAAAFHTPLRHFPSFSQQNSYTVHTTKP